MYNPYSRSQKLLCSNERIFNSPRLESSRKMEIIRNTRSYSCLNSYHTNWKNSKENQSTQMNSNILSSNTERDVTLNHIENLEKSIDQTNVDIMSVRSDHSFIKNTHLTPYKVYKIQNQVRDFNDTSFVGSTIENRQSKDREFLQKYYSMLPEKKHQLYVSQEKYNLSTVESKHKIRNQRNIDLLEKLRIKSMEIDLIQNGTPLSSIKGKTGKMSVEEMQKIVEQTIIPTEPVEKKVFVKDRDVLSQVIDTFAEEDIDNFNKKLKQGKENYFHVFKTNTVEDDFEDKNLKAERDRKKINYGKKNSAGQINDQMADINWNFSAYKF